MSSPATNIKYSVVKNSVKTSDCGFYVKDYVAYCSWRDSETFWELYDPEKDHERYCDYDNNKEFYKNYLKTENNEWLTEEAAKAKLEILVKKLNGIGEFSKAVKGQDSGNFDEFIKEINEIFEKSADVNSFLSYFRMKKYTSKSESDTKYTLTLGDSEKPFLEVDQIFLMKEKVAIMNSMRLIEWKDDTSQM